MTILTRSIMRQGEIWYADLNPMKGSDQAGRRPLVIISGNLLNKYLKVVITVPLNSKIKHYQGNPILKPNAENGLKLTSEMMIFHIRSISKDRLIEKMGNVKKSELDLAVKTLNGILTY